VPEADLSRVQAPAGLDLGATDHREIAVAVLAELVARRARGEFRSAVTAAIPEPTSSELAIDPVCGMTVEIAASRWHTEDDGRRQYFCSPGCMQTFTANPEMFAGKGSLSP
jgi:xanthine dehydrogenase accessory factor